MFAILYGLSATVCCIVFAPDVLMLFADEMVSGMFLVFEVLFNTDHKRFGFSLASLPKSLKNVSLLLRNMHVLDF